MQGGKIPIETSSSETTDAVQAFLLFQIVDRKTLVDGSALTTATGERKNNWVYLAEPRVYKDGHPADRTGKSHS